MNRSSGANQTTYTYGGADELTSVTPPGQSAIPYSYDANGSLTGRGSDSFSWDAANRLSSQTVGGTTTSMSYTGDGLRATRSSGGVTTSYVWDVESGELLDDGTYQYVYGLGAGPLERVATASQATVYYLPDGLGSTAAIVDQSGTTVQGYTYDVYGQATPSSQTFGNEVQYAGQQTDPSGLQYLRARYYDPATGRFLSRDTAGGHPYVYAGNSPAAKADPSGHCTVNVVPTAVAGPFGGHIAVQSLFGETESTGYIPVTFQAGPSGSFPFFGSLVPNNRQPTDLLAIGPRTVLPEDGIPCDAPGGINSQLQAVQAGLLALNSNSRTAISYNPLGADAFNCGARCSNSGGYATSLLLAAGATLQQIQDLRVGLQEASGRWFAGFGTPVPGINVTPYAPPQAYIGPEALAAVQALTDPFRFGGTSY